MMGLFLAFHAGEVLAQRIMARAFEDRLLGAVDVHGGQFAGVVDAQHLGASCARGAKAGARGRLGHAAAGRGI